MHSKLLAFYCKHTTDVLLFRQMMFAFLQGPRSNFVQVQIHQVCLRHGPIINQLLHSLSCCVQSMLQCSLATGACSGGSSFGQFCSSLSVTHHLGTGYVYLSTVGHMQFEQYNIRMFQLLDLTPEQRAACADLWRRWVQTRQMLHDRQAALAHSLYTMLPGLPDISASFLAALGAQSGRRSFPDDGPWSFTQYRSVGRGGGHEWARRLVGVSPSATAVAGTLVVQLRQLLLDDAIQAFDFTAGADSYWHRLGQQQQLLWQMLPTEEDGCLFDFFKLAQIATNEQRQLSVTRRL
jgi:hypothetical protein